MPQGEGQGAHKRTVPIILFLTGASTVGRNTRGKSLKGCTSLDAAVKDLPVGSEGPLLEPIQKLPGKNLEVERTTFQGRRQQTECLRPIIRPGTRRHSRMGAAESGGRIELYFQGTRQLSDGRVNS